jgi:HTH-type transcriptional regulator / antitoxin HigA
MLYGKGQDAYLELIRKFPLRPIRSEKELDQAISVLDELVVKAKLTQAEDDYLDVLSDLVEQYETVHHPIPPLPDGEMLSFLIEMKDVSQTQVARGTGIANSTISEVLSGHRDLTRQQITKVAKYFHVDPGVFMSAD